MSSAGLKVVAGIAAVIAAVAIVYIWVDIGSGRDAAVASTAMHKGQRCQEQAPASGCELYAEQATVDGESFGGLLVEPQDQSNPNFKVGYTVPASLRVNEPSLTSGDQVTVWWWGPRIVEVDDPGHAPYLSSDNPDAYRPTWPFIAPVAAILVIIAVAALLRARTLSSTESSPDALARIRARQGGDGD